MMLSTGTVASTVSGYHNVVNKLAGGNYMVQGAFAAMCAWRFCLNGELWFRVSSSHSAVASFWDHSSFGVKCASCPMGLIHGLPQHIPQTLALALYTTDGRRWMDGWTPPQILRVGSLWPTKRRTTQNEATNLEYTF